MRLAFVVPLSVVGALALVACVGGPDGGVGSEKSGTQTAGDEPRAPTTSGGAAAEGSSPREGGGEPTPSGGGDTGTAGGAGTDGSGGASTTDPTHPDCLPYAQTYCGCLAQNAAADCVERMRKSCEDGYDLCPGDMSRHVSCATSRACDGGWGDACKLDYGKC